MPLATTSCAISAWPNKGDSKGLIPTWNGIAPKGNGGLYCHVANFQPISGASPSPDSPMRPEQALTQGTNPQASPRLGVLLWQAHLALRCGARPYIRARAPLRKAPTPQGILSPCGPPTY
jgi:hypothetical protein